MSLGARIASMRGFRRLTQEQLGAAIGVTKQTISGWENGYRTPDADSLKEMCGVLDCSSDYLLGLSDEIKGNSNH